MCSWQDMKEHKWTSSSQPLSSPACGVQIYASQVQRSQQERSIGVGGGEGGLGHKESPGFPDESSELWLPDPYRSLDPHLTYWTSMV